MVGILLLLASDGVASTIFTTNSNDSGPGSLRQAILDANANPGPDEIRPARDGFASVLTDLPVVVGPVTIRNFAIFGREGTASNGLVATGPDVDLISIVLAEFPGDGIILRDATSSQIKSSTIWNVGGNGIVV